MGLGTRQGASHFIDFDLVVYVCGCVFKTNSKWKENSYKEVFGAAWTKDTFVSACYTHTHTHIHTSWPYVPHACHAHSHTQSSPLEPGSFQLYFPDPFISRPLLSRSLLARLPRPSAPWPATALPDVASIVRLARLALLLLSLLACFFCLLLLLVLPADTTPKVP